jgi:hypothetical protein
MFDVELKKMISDLKRTNRIITMKRRGEKLRKLQSGSNYMIDLYFLKPREDGYLEEIPLEGYENLLKISTEYRRIGHRIGLSKMVFRLDDKKFHTINFKY